MPLGPAVARAVTYCGPAVLKASDGPDSVRPTGWLSMYIRSEGADATPAAF